MAQVVYAGTQPTDEVAISLAQGKSAPDAYPGKSLPALHDEAAARLSPADRCLSDQLMNHAADVRRDRNSAPRSDEGIRGKAAEVVKPYAGLCTPGM